MEQKGRQKYNRTILTRVVILMSLFGFVLFVVLGYQLYNITITRHDELETKAIEQQTQSDIITPNRGTIYDRNMNPLAISATAETVSIAPYYIKTDAEAALIAEGLSDILGLDKDVILEKTTRKNRKYELILPKIDKALADEVRAFIVANDLGGMININPDSKRYYPNGSLASTIVGFVGVDNNGLMGLEARQDKALTGVAGQTMTAQNNSGEPLPMQYEMYYDAVDGYDLTLTIDQTIQFFLEKHLETAVIENEVAQRGCGIVMDVKTGAILAMATKNDTDLNDPYILTDPSAAAALESLLGQENYGSTRSELLNAQWRNKAISDTYEPGSVFKVLTAAMAIEEGVVNLANDNYNCSGSMTVTGWNRPIKCHKTVGHGPQTFLESLLHSCNPAFIQIGQKIGPEKFYSYLEGFGLMDRTGIDLQGEANSIVGSWEQYSKDMSAQAVYSFGQTFAVTPLQMISAIASLANDGNLMKPYIVSRVTDSDGNLVESHTPEVVRQVISKETSDIMRDYMKECVERGTGSNAYVKGYRVAGKTGTSQKRDKDPNNELKLYVVSFAGFAPADNPEVAILIMLDEPGGPLNQRMGGYMAAPVAGRVLADILPYMGITPIYSEGESADLIEVTVPYVQNLSVEDAKKAAGSNMEVEIIGMGSTVQDQLPAAGAVVPSGTTLVLYTDSGRPADMVLMPSVVGMTPEQANTAVVNAGLIMRPMGAQGVGTASPLANRQSHGAGTELPYGTVVEVEFVNDNVRDADLNH